MGPVIIVVCRVPSALSLFGFLRSACSRDHSFRFWFLSECLELGVRMDILSMGQTIGLGLAFGTPEQRHPIAVHGGLASRTTT